MGYEQWLRDDLIQHLPKSVLLATRELLLNCLRPLLLEGPFHNVCALSRVRRRRVERPAITEDQLDVFRELLHRRVLAVAQLR